MIILSFCEIELRMKRRAEIVWLDVLEWFLFCETGSRSSGLAAIWMLTLAIGFCCDGFPCDRHRKVHNSKRKTV
jgi:hypothetical protein